MNAREIAHTSEKQQDIQLSANWYRALTLAERATLFAQAGDPASNIAIEISESAQKRLTRWKEQAPFNEGTYFAQRLEMLGLTEESFLQLLNEPVEALKDRMASQPEWLRTLRSVFQDTSSQAEEFPQALKGIQDELSRSFLGALQPLLIYTWRRLRTGIDRLAERYATLPFDPEKITMLAFSLLPDTLLQRSAKTFILELNVARVQGLLQGDTPEERFQSFVQRLRVKENMLALLEEYAALSRVLVETCERWLVVQLEILEHLCADWENIRATFSPDKDPGVLVEIQNGKGDTHRGGRSVAILRWSSGFTLVYKPRSFAMDQHFQELLTWLNEKGFQPEFRTLRMLDKGDHGWMEFVRPTPCNTVDEVERFYQRQGGYLAILYALHAGDFHADNIIACGEHPFLIDLEVLFLPRLKPISHEDESDQLGDDDRPPHTVLHVGMLPNRIWANEDDAGIDISALGGRPGQLSPTPVAVIQGMGTDEMRVGHERLGLVMGQNQPTLQNGDVEILSYSESFVAGFVRVYRLIMHHREEFLTQVISRFTDVDVRCLPRNTQLYDVLLEHSYHPNLLRDALDRDRLFDRLWLNTDELPRLKPLLKAELTDLWAGDIPFFYTHASSRDLFSGHGDCVPEFFSQSGIDLVHSLIPQFDEHDLERQCWIIRSSFINLGVPPGRSQYPSLKVEPVMAPFSRERALDAAMAAGDRLLELRLENGEYLDWLSLATKKSGQWGLYSIDIDLYNGMAGVIFYLAYLGALTDEEKYSSVAKHALRILSRQMQYRRENGYPEAIGGYNGLGSYIYLLSHLGTLWGDSALYLEAEEYVGPLAEAVPQDVMFDVMAGAAGAIGGLLSLYRVHPSEATLDAAIKCGEHLLAKKTPQEVGIGWIPAPEKVALAGMAHGNAGIALNLLRLADASGDPRFSQAALQAFAYERHLFSSDAKNWPDIRTRGDDKQVDEHEKYKMVAWCHGGSGIALARMGSLPYIDDEAIRQEIEVGVEATMTRGFGNSHSLCHGDMGNMDTLLTAAQVLGKSEYLNAIERIAAKLLDTIDRQGWVSGAPMGMETPGLMLGVSGAGYGWLRLAFQNYVPSVLMLEPPLKR